MDRRVIYKEIGDVLGVLRVMDKWEDKHPDYTHILIVTPDNKYFIDIHRNATEESEGLS